MKQTPAGMDPERLANIPIRMEAFVEKGTIAGAVTLVARRGVVTSLEAVGDRDRENHKPMLADTIVDIRSMTKPVTAVGILILVEVGRLKLSHPVERYLPAFRDQPLIEETGREGSSKSRRPSRPITVSDLMTHTSGMPGLDTPRQFGPSPWFEYRLRDSVGPEPLQFEPGTQFLYSDAGFDTLGRIIEVVAGQPYQDFLQERIFGPLGMADTFFFPPREKYDLIASVYGLKEGQLQKSPIDALYRRTWKDWRCASPSAGLYTTAPDFFAFLQMMLSGGTYNGQRVLSRTSVKLMTTVHTRDLRDRQPGWEGMGYGLGVRVIRELIATAGMQSVGSYGHGGMLGTWAWNDPRTEVTSVFLIQRFSDGAAEERLAFTAMATAATAD